MGPGDALPEIDYYIHLLSLPRVFGTDLDTIPAEVPYLHAELGIDASAGQNDWQTATD